MKSSPIYNIIDNPGRKSDCSFGARDRFTQTICVGTSKQNSHEFLDIQVSKVALENGTSKFRLWIDGDLFKSGILEGQVFTFDQSPASS